MTLADWPTIAKCMCLCPTPSGTPNNYSQTLYANKANNDSITLYYVQAGDSTPQVYTKTYSSISKQFYQTFLVCDISWYNTHNFYH